MRECAWPAAKATPGKHWAVKVAKRHQSLGTSRGEEPTHYLYNDEILHCPVACPVLTFSFMPAPYPAGLGMGTIRGSVARHDPKFARSGPTVRPH